MIRMNIRLPNGRKQTTWIFIYMCRWRLEPGSTGVLRNNSSWGKIGAVESATCKSALTPGTPEL